MIILKEKSAGDIRLCKFLIITIDKIPGVLENKYVDEITAYFIIEYLYFNKLTREFKNWIEHDTMKQELPDEIKYYTDFNYPSTNLYEGAIYYAQERIDGWIEEDAKKVLELFIDSEPSLKIQDWIRKTLRREFSWEQEHIY